MLEVSKIESKIDESFSSIKENIKRSRKELKDFKVEQAKVINRIIEQDDSQEDLASKLEEFQKDLIIEENKCKGKIFNSLYKEIETLKKDVLDNLDLEDNQEDLEDYSTIDIEENASIDDIVLFDNENEEDDSIDDIVVFDNGNEEDNVDDIVVFDNEEENYFTQDIEKEFKEVTNRFFEKQRDDIPFETEELDEWIKEIKKLI